MAYLAKFRRNGKTYFYLAENIALGGGKRKQIREYIGDRRPSESRLQVLMPEFEKKAEKETLKLQTILNKRFAKITCAPRSSRH